MKLSEAILLGSTMLKPKGGALVTANGESGCALGMACKAIGVDASKLESFADILTVFPWTSRRLTDSDVPCRSIDPTCNVAQGIAHLFDSHVMGMFLHRGCINEPWTLEKLADWVASIEPQPEPQAMEGRDPSHVSQTAEMMSRK